MRELSASKGGPEVKLFYDYYALWVINKKVSEHAALLNNSEQLLKSELPQHVSILKNTFA